MAPDERQRFTDAIRRAEAIRDRRLRDEGERLLAEYSAGDRTRADALRAYVRELLP